MNLTELCKPWTEQGYGSEAEILKELFRRHKIKQDSVKQREGIEFNLTPAQHFSMLLEEHNGKPVFAQIGCSSNSLCLMRNNDKGHYEVGNCSYNRFGNNASEAFAGRTHTTEAKTKISNAHKGKQRSAEHSAKIGAGNKGKIISTETRDKISTANTGKTRSAETRAKISNALKGKKRSAEHNANHSAALKKYYEKKRNS